MRVAVAALLVVAGTLPALAQKSYEIQQPRGTWQTPGPIQQPKAPWQVPGEIQQPKGTWQVPGEIQVPKGIQAVRASAAGCERRVSVVGDALFDFDKANLRPDAEETLVAAGPEIAKLGGKPGRIEGHTDAIGSDSYNMRLSEARATARRTRAGAGHDADQRLRQDQSDRAQPDQRRTRRSGRPAEEPPSRGGVRRLQLTRPPPPPAPEPHRRPVVSRS